VCACACVRVGGGWSGVVGVGGWIVCVKQKHRSSSSRKPWREKTNLCLRTCVKSVRECVSETSVLVSGGMAHYEGTSVLSSLLYSQHSTLASTSRCFVLFKKKRAVRRSLPLRQRAAAATAS
jgi:hypothetical protein